MSIDTAIESMIESYIDDQDFVSRTDASMEAESYTDQCISDLKIRSASLLLGSKPSKNLKPSKIKPVKIKPSTC
jgi:hypothetical protein